MASVKLIQNNFISGEVSPLLEGRIESARYQTGLRTCQNALPHRYGGWMKRPGTWYAGVPAAKARLMEFIDPDGRSFIIELSNLKARIWSQETMALLATELVTPWATADLPGLKSLIVDGSMYVVHTGHAPRIISNLLGTFTISTPTFTGDRTFSSAGDYPGAVFSIAGRLGLTGTTNEPTAVFLSKSPVAMTGANRFHDFAFTDASGYVAADSAIYLLESDLSSILWAAGGQRLFTGTRQQVWADTGTGVTPFDFDMAIMSSSGSAEVQAVISENAVIYAGRGGKSLHAIIQAGGSYQQVNLSTGADHFLASPAVDIAMQNFPAPILWIVRADGLLVSCSLDLEGGMIAWARHPMAGALVESVAVGHSDTEDILWLSVLRGTTRTIEYLKFQGLVDTASADFHFVDCGLALTPASATVTGLAHLEGKTVAGWADGAIVPDKTVASGQVTYATAVAKIHIGYPIATLVETLRPEVMANGTSQGNYKQIEDAMLRVYRSAGGKIGISGGGKTTLSTWKATTQSWNEILAPYTGDVESKLASPIEKNATLVVEHARASPFNVLAVVYRVGMKEV